MKNIQRQRSYRVRRILEIIRTGSRDGHRFPSAADIAGELDVSWRTIIRDLDYLRDDEGAPIAYDASRKGYFLSRKEWSLRPVTLTAREVETLAMSSQMFQPFRGTPMENDLQSLYTKIGMALEGDVSIPFGRAGDPVSFISDDFVPVDQTRWSKVVGFIRKQTPVAMRYTTFRNETRVYEVTPVHMFAYHGNWYLVGFGRGSAKAITFAISRIKNIRALAEEGWAPEKFDAQKYIRGAYGIAGGEKPIQIRVRASPTIAAYMAERIWHPSQRVRWRKDGSLEISFTTSGRKEVVRWVLSWQPDLVVVSPAHLRERVLFKMKEGIKAGSAAARS